MSKYLLFEEFALKDRGLLLGALADLGYPEVEEGEALGLHGYRGDERPETAQLVVRRRHVGRFSNDLGFARTERGYVPIVSEYDRSMLRDGRFLAELRAAYGERAVRDVARRLRGTTRRTVEGDVVKITVRY